MSTPEPMPRVQVEVLLERAGLTLSPAQVDEIVTKRALVGAMTVRAPCEEDCDPEKPAGGSPRPGRPTCSIMRAPPRWARGVWATRVVTGSM